MSGARSAEHMRIGFVDPGVQLRMLGGLGPLQGMGLHGALDWMFPVAMARMARDALAAATREAIAALVAAAIATPKEIVRKAERASQAE